MRVVQPGIDKADHLTRAGYAGGIAIGRANICQAGLGAEFGARRPNIGVGFPPVGYGFQGQGRTCVG